MDTLRRYLDLMTEHPELFHNADEPGIVKIITDPDRIVNEHKRLVSEFRAKGKPEHYIDIGMLTEDEWYWVLRDLVEFPDGRIGGYIRKINRKSRGEGGYNSVLFCFQGENVIMIRKFDHDDRDWIWEFPRGFGEPGLSAEENARKELEEEIGAVPKKMELLTLVEEGKGGTAVFLVELPGEQQITLERGEGIASYRWVSLSELDSLVAQGKLTDWFSMWAYALFKAKQIEPRY